MLRTGIWGNQLNSRHPRQLAAGKEGGSGQQNVNDIQYERSILVCVCVCARVEERDKREKSYILRPPQRMCCAHKKGGHVRTHTHTHTHPHERLDQYEKGLSPTQRRRSHSSSEKERRVIIDIVQIELLLFFFFFFFFSLPQLLYYYMLTTLEEEYKKAIQ